MQVNTIIARRLHKENVLNELTTIGQKRVISSRVKGTAIISCRIKVEILHFLSSVLQSKSRLTSIT